MTIKAAYIEIDRLFDSGEISDATYQTAADWIGLCDIDEQGDEMEVSSEQLPRLTQGSGDLSAVLDSSSYMFN